MPRQKNSYKNTVVRFGASPKLVSYLDDLVKSEGFGDTPAEVAKRLVWEQINRLIATGRLRQR